VQEHSTRYIYLLYGSTKV